MVWERPSGAEVAAAVAARQSELVERLAEPADLGSPSRLPGWSRTTIVCHLRYGAIASRQVTTAALAGLPASFYPEGRTHQRPATLELRTGESTLDLVRSLADEAARLDRSWQRVRDDEWSTDVREPADNRDLGTISLWMLALLRLTEVEVHGRDLDLGLDAWSETFVRAALPSRIEWLRSRRSNHRPVDDAIDGSWSFVVDDGPVFDVESNAAGVHVAATTSPHGRAILSGSGAALLGYLLGRVQHDELRLGGDVAMARRFHDAFPPP